MTTKRPYEAVVKEFFKRAGAYDSIEEYLLSYSDCSEEERGVMNRVLSTELRNKTTEGIVRMFYGINYLHQKVPLKRIEELYSRSRGDVLKILRDVNERLTSVGKSSLDERVV